MDSLGDKAKDVAGEHSDQVDQGLEKGGDMVDDKTDGKYSDQVDQGQDKVGDALGGGDDQNG